MIEKITLDMFTRDSVDIKKQKFALVEGVEYPISETWRKGYENSIQGREQLQNEVPDPYKSVILLMWGDTPTVVEDINLV